MNKNLKKLLSALCAITVTFSAVSIPVSAEEAETTAAAETAVDEAAETAEEPAEDAVPFDELERIEGTNWETTFTVKDGFLTWTDPDTSLYPVNPNPVLWECVAEYEVFVNGTRMIETKTQFGAKWDYEKEENVLNGEINYPKVYLPAIVSKYVIDGGDTSAGAIVTIKAHKTPKDGDTSVVIDSCTTTFDASAFVGTKSDTIKAPMISATATVKGSEIDVIFSAGGVEGAAGYVFVMENTFEAGKKEIDYNMPEGNGSVSVALWGAPTDITPDIKIKAYAVDANGNYGTMCPEISVNHATGAVTKAKPEALASLDSWAADLEFYSDSGDCGFLHCTKGNTADSGKPYCTYYLMAFDAAGNLAGTVKTFEAWINPETGKPWGGDKEWLAAYPIFAAHNLVNSDKALSGTYDIYIAADTDNDGKVDIATDNSFICTVNAGSKNADIEKLTLNPTVSDGNFVQVPLPDTGDETVTKLYAVEYIFSVDTDNYTIEYNRGGESGLWFGGEEQEITIRVTPFDQDGNYGDTAEAKVTLGVPVSKWEPEFEFNEKTGILTWKNVITESEEGYDYQIFDAKSGFEYHYWVQPQWNDELHKNVIPKPEVNLPQAFAEYALGKGITGEGTYELTIQAYTNWDNATYKAAKKFTYTYGGLKTNELLKPRVIFASSYPIADREFNYDSKIVIGAQDAYTHDNAVGFIFKFDVENEDTRTKEKPSTVTVIAVDKNGNVSAPVTAAVQSEVYPEAGLIYGNDFDEDIDFDNWHWQKNIANGRYGDFFDLTKAAKFEYVFKVDDPSKLSDSFGGAVVALPNGDWKQQGFWGIDDPANGLFAASDDFNTLKIVPGTEKGTYVISADISELNPYYGKTQDAIDTDYFGMTFIIWANDDNPAFTGTGLYIDQANVYDKDGNLLIRFDNGGHAFTAPENFNVADSKSTAYLSFRKVFGADHYDIYQDGKKIDTLQQFEGYNYTYVVNGLENDTENGYKFKVAAVSKDGIEMFTEERDAYPSSWSGVGISYMDKNGEWKWADGPSEGKNFANADEALTYAATLTADRIDIHVKNKEEEIKAFKQVPASVKEFHIVTDPASKLTISSKAINVPDKAEFIVNGNIVFSGKTTISSGADSIVAVSSDEKQGDKTALTLKGKKSKIADLNGLSNVAAISGFDEMMVFGCTVKGAVKGGYLHTGDTIYNGAVTLTADLNNGYNCTFNKAIKADGFVNISGATVKGAITTASSINAHDCTLAAVTATGKKLTATKWEDGNDICPNIERCTTGKISSDLTTALIIKQSKVKGAVTSKGGLSVETYDISDPTSIKGAVTAAKWLNISNSDVDGKVTGGADVSINNSTVTGLVTGKNVDIHGSEIGAVTGNGTDTDNMVYIENSIIKGKLTSTTHTVVSQSDVKGAITSKGVFEFYGFETDGVPESVIGGAVTISDKTGKSVIYNAKITGKVSAAKDLEIGTVIASKGVAAKGTLTASTSEVRDAVSAETLSTNWGGILKFVSLSVTKGGFVKSTDNPDVWLGLEVIKKDGTTVTGMSPEGKNNVVSKKFIGTSCEGLFLSKANCNTGHLEINNKKLIIAK